MIIWEGTWGGRDEGRLVSHRLLANLLPRDEASYWMLNVCNIVEREQSHLLFSSTNAPLFAHSFANTNRYYIYGCEMDQLCLRNLLSYHNFFSSYRLLRVLLYARFRPAQHTASQLITENSSASTCKPYDAQRDRGKKLASGLGSSKA